MYSVCVLFWQAHTTFDMLKVDSWVIYAKKHFANLYFGFLLLLISWVQIRNDWQTKSFHEDWYYTNTTVEKFEWLTGITRTSAQTFPPSQDYIKHSRSLMDVCFCIKSEWLNNCLNFVKKL